MFIKNGGFRKHTHIISYVPPFIVEQPIGGTVSSNQSFQLKTLAKGSRPISYQWYRNNVLLNGKTENILSFLSCQPGDNGSYVCKVSNNNHEIYTNSVDLIVLFKPIIITDIVSLSSIPATTTSLSISATGSVPLTYTWYKNNILYNASSSNTLFINDTKKADEGVFYAVVSNLIGSVTSSSASLFVYDKLQIVTQPNNIVLNTGQNSTTNLSCTGTTPITAQWRKNGINYGSSVISNGHSFNLVFNNIQLSDEGNYDCVLTNIAGSIISNKSQVFTNKTLAFTLQPLSTSAYVGDTVTFTTNTSGTAPINYQWIKRYYGNIIGNVNNTYTIDDVQLSASGDYACVVSNIVGSITSEFVSLSVSSSYLLTENDDYITYDSNVYWKYITSSDIVIYTKHSIAAGFSHTLALGTDGTLSAWGENTYGQLGNNSTTDSKVPIKINLPPVSAIAAGDYHTLALGTDGTLSAWGYNNSGQLGNGSTADSHVPIKINLPPVAAIADGIYHTLALGTDGTLSAWGNNTYGQLGNNSTTNSSVPIKINLPPVAAIACGFYHTFAVGTDGGLSAWGYNARGQLGNNSTTDSSVPIKINLPPVAAIACGFYHTFAVGTDGGLSAWGYNNFGQLGNGSTTDSKVPIKISLPPVAAIAGGFYHTLAVGTDGGLSAWGYNITGQLGNNSTTDSHVPIKINLPLIKTQ